jgi:hypothetical protein
MLRAGPSSIDWISYSISDGQAFDRQDAGAGACKVAGGTNGGGSDAAGDAITQA